MPARITPGFRFKDGRLHIFTADGVMILETWPVLRALRKHEGGPWEEFAPVFRVVQPYRPRRERPSTQMELALGPEAAPRPDSLAAQRKRAFDAFRFSLPRDIAARVEKFRSRQWRMLQLFRERQEALDLARQNPALCFALGNFHSFVATKGRPALDAAVAASGGRQRDIAGWLGFPATDGAARTLAKLAPESASVELLLPLRAAMKDAEVAKTLAHLPTLNTGALAIVSDPALRSAALPGLVAEVAAMPAEKYLATIARLMADALRMHSRLHPSAGTPKLRSVARVREFHREVSIEYLRESGATVESFRFPRPPLPGTPDIVPICTHDELTEEGRQQDNCVATFAECVQSRETFIYRVLRPERATLSIVRDDDANWRIDQLETRSNRPACYLTIKMVNAWLDEHAISA